MHIFDILIQSMKYVKRDKDKVQYLRLNTKYMYSKKYNMQGDCSIPLIGKKNRITAQAQAMSQAASFWASIEASCIMLEIDTRRLIDVQYGVQSTKFTIVMTVVNWW